jgi:hypothetical protein
MSELIDSLDDIGMSVRAAPLSEYAFKHNLARHLTRKRCSSNFGRRQSIGQRAACSLRARRKPITLAVNSAVTISNGLD